MHGMLARVLGEVGTPVATRPKAKVTQSLVPVGRSVEAEHRCRKGEVRKHCTIFQFLPSNFSHREHAFFAAGKPEEHDFFAAGKPEVCSMKGDK